MGPPDGGPIAGRALQRRAEPEVGSSAATIDRVSTSPPSSQTDRRPDSSRGRRRR
jgi:hypothetical protein